MPAKVIKKRFFFILFPRKSEKKMDVPKVGLVSGPRGKPLLGDSGKGLGNDASRSVTSAVGHDIARVAPCVSPPLENISL